jgi:hypothetical protein
VLNKQSNGENVFDVQLPKDYIVNLFTACTVRVAELLAKPLFGIVLLLFISSSDVT